MKIILVLITFFTQFISIKVSAAPLDKTITIKNLAHTSDAGDSLKDFMDVTLSNPWVRKAQKKHNTAAFIEIMNVSDRDLQIVKADCADAQITEMHISLEENHVHKMRPVSFISIDKGETTVLQPGGLHIMLINLKKDLVVGKKVNIILTFNNGHKLTVPFIIKDTCSHCH